MKISLSPEVEKLIKERIKSGMFDTPEEVIAAGVRSLGLPDRLGDFAPGEMDELIAEGERSIKEEGTLDGDEAFQARQDRIRARHSRQ